MRFKLTLMILLSLSSSTLLAKNLATPKLLAEVNIFDLFDMEETLINRTQGGLKLYNEQSGAIVTSLADQDYIVTSINQEDASVTFSIRFIDIEAGNVDHEGIPVHAPNPPITYRIEKEDLEKDQMSFIAVHLNPEKLSPPTLRPECDVTNATAASSPDETAYEYFRKNRAEFIDLNITGEETADQVRAEEMQCHLKKGKAQNHFLKNHEYGKLDINGRANKVYTDSLQVFAEMSLSKDNKPKSLYRDFVNGSYIDPLMSPALMACISYQETRGSLNPFAFNYSFCKKEFFLESTAHGLGQMTVSAMIDMEENEDGELLPLNTLTSQKYIGMDAKKIHSKMSSDPKMQLEVSMRLLSANLKYVRWRLEDHSDTYPPRTAEEKDLTNDQFILRRAIIVYDRDNESKYVKNVFNNCLPCFKEKGSTGSLCYQRLE